MLLGRLGASLLGNLLTGKGAFHAGKGVNEKGKGIHRAGEEIVRAGVIIQIFNTASSLN